MLAMAVAAAPQIDAAELLLLAPPRVLGRVLPRADRCGLRLLRSQAERLEGLDSEIERVLIRSGARPSTRAGDHMASCGLTFRWNASSHYRSPMNRVLRHLVGVVLGVLTLYGLWHTLPRATAGLSWNFLLSTTRPEELGLDQPTPGRSVEPLLLMLGLIILLILVTAVRWVSPIASVIAGLPVVLLSLYVLADPGVVNDLFDPQTGRDRYRSELIYQGFYLLIGAVVLAPAAIPSRWRFVPGRKARPAAEATAASADTAA